MLWLRSASLFEFSNIAYYRPLWLDENALAFNLVNRSFFELLQPLDYAQAAPPGFLFLEKAVIQTLGVSTYTLRLVPLLAGIGSIFLVWELARRVAPSAMLLIVGLFATSNYLIYYSAEAKQYSLDVFIAAGLLLMFDMLRTRMSRRSCVFATVLSAVSVWVSHPALFVLGGGSFVLFIIEPALRRRLIVIIAAWALSFITAYMLFYRTTSANTSLTSYWAAAFFQPDLAWTLNAVSEVFVFAVGRGQLIMFILAITGVIIGMRSLPRSQTGLLLLPIIITYIASVLQKYPFNGRLLLFLEPGLIVVIGVGLQAFISAIASKRRWLVSILCMLFLLLPISSYRYTSNSEPHG